MDFTKALKHLTDDTCPSIKYRTRKEILCESIHLPVMLNLQNEILHDERVKELFDLQHEDGWIGGWFHGEKEPESAIRYFMEKGVESDNEMVARALNAIINRGDDFDKGSMERVGKPLDSLHLGGSQMMKACVFAYAKHEEHDSVKEQIEEALAGFEYILFLDSLDQLYHKHKGKVDVFNEGTKWPSIYHLRLLAYTDGWRTAKNKQILISAFQKLIDFSPIPPIKLLYKNQVISPASVFMDDFNVNMNNLSAKEWMVWFHRTEMIARLGIANDIPQIKNQIDYLYEYVHTNDGFFVKPLSHYYFTKWTQYIGIALENDWKIKGARMSDLTFRSLLILHLDNRL